MTLFPTSRRIRSFQGPHSTCMQSGETYARRLPRKGGRESIFDYSLHQSLIVTQIRFNIYFASAILTACSFVLSSIGFIIIYACMHLFLRFQYKLSILLILMGRHRVDFNSLNVYLVYCLHIWLLLIGGFGWTFLLFIEM